MSRCSWWFSFGFRMGCCLKGSACGVADPSGLSARALDRGLDVTAPARERLDVAVDLADSHNALEGRSVVVVVEDEIAVGRPVADVPGGRNMRLGRAVQRQLAR